MVAFHWPVMCSYLCSIASLGLGGTIIKLHAIKLSRTIIPNKKKCHFQYAIHTDFYLPSTSGRSRFRKAGLRLHAINQINDIFHYFSIGVILHQEVCRLSREDKTRHRHTKPYKFISICQLVEKK